jgi:DNA-binding ferritin-like protein
MRGVVAAAANADDAVTADFLTGLKAQHEKDAWMLRAILRG